MTEFDDARQRYASARADKETARSELAQAVEHVKRLERQGARRARTEEPHDDDGGNGDEGGGENALELARREVVERRTAFAGARDGAALAGVDFAALIDPAVTVRQLPDDVPIALFPLRLETRFATVREGRVAHRFLYVRVYPDDVLVDTFQDRIAQAEFDKVVLYWTQRWRAGGDVAGHRAAWAGLVRGAGAGRAHWLTEQVTPLNPADEPTITTGQHVLLIRPSVPVPVAERAAVSAFWSRVWSTSGVERDQAFADLVTALGAGRAEEVEERLEPVNLRDPDVKPSDDVTPVVAYLDLPDPLTLPVSQDGWGRPARASLLPERLVLLGFQDGTQTLRQYGAPIPPDLQVGPDPAAADSEQIKADGPDLELPVELAWLTDFDEAVTKGMGFKVDLTEHGLAPAFDRLFVLGIRLAGDPTEAADDLTELITHHQASRKGFSLLPQGRPTNNTDASTAGYTWWEDPDESFRHFFEADPTDDPGEWSLRKDGAWLAGALGLAPELLKRSVNYYGTDQAEARAMNVALWPSTLGYYMEQMMESAFSEATVRTTRDFFNRFVIGRGTVPLVRVGKQPYGVLPATVWSRAAWWTDVHYVRAARALGLPDAGYLNALNELGKKATGFWENMAASVRHVGQASHEPQKTLLNIVGLHPTSAEHYQRYANSYAQHHNTLTFGSEAVMGFAGTPAMQYLVDGLKTLGDLGWHPPLETVVPKLLEKVFLKKPNLLKGMLVEAELSESKSLSVTRTDGRNYLDWLQWAARQSHDVLRKQAGFGDDAVPTALLYLMIHHSLDLGYIETDLQLRRELLGVSDEVFLASRREPSFLQVAETGTPSRWLNLYRPELAITGDATMSMGEYIPKVLETRSPYLNTQLTALDVLKGATTAALERAFVEHLDCLSYRLDAWRLGVQAVQLAHMRADSEEGFGRSGVHVGAYGWLEHLSADDTTPEPVRLDDELAEIFQRPDDLPLTRDPSNYGHILAPSLDHAVTAAILRNGHLANATPQAPELLAVDISSERVRWALDVIEGIRNGQPLGALLGYRLERLLHDEPTLYLDRLIYEFRRAFPLAGNRNRITLTALGKGEITKVEARNVVDGAAFADHVAKTGEDTYPYGLSGLPALTELVQPGSPSAAQIGVLVDGCVTEMRQVADAVADLTLAEGVYQVVRGNYDRAAGALDAVSKGTQPHQPEVAATPRNGTTLTHRVVLHLRGGLSPSDPSNTTPRAVGEPALAAWLSSQLPDPATIFARVSWHNEAANTNGQETPSMAQLGLGPVDLFYLLDSGGAASMPGFDELLIDYAERVGGPAPRHDAVFALEYKPDAVAGLTLFEVAPLVRALRGVVLGARPLRPTDLALQNEASARQDTGGVVRIDKVGAVLTALQGTTAAVDAFVATVTAAVDKAPDDTPVDAELARDAARDGIDGWIADYAAAVRPVLPFGLPTASATAAVEARRARFTALRHTLDELIERWQAKQTEYDEVMVEYAALPVTATDDDRTTLLIKAGRVVSTTVIAPLPPTIAALETEVAGLRDDLDAALTAVTATRDGATSVGATLQAITAAVPTIAAVDQTPFELGALRDTVLFLAIELRDRAAALAADIATRTKAATDALAKATSAVGDKAQKEADKAAKALLGEAYVLLPEFTLSAPQLAEWNNVWANKTELLTHLTTGPDATPFPVDDWHHGVGRVRERMRNLEQTVLLGEALGSDAPPDLEVLQFPYRPDESWLGLRFPATMPDGSPFALTEDKLLYSAVFATGAQVNPAAPATSYSGLLLDEWVEVIPSDDVTTGLAFHFDRPNSEAPQAILLATPPVYRGGWEWQDIVDTLHETLDFARLRAVEPTQVDQSKLAPLLPAVLSSVTTYPITAGLNLSINNDIHLLLAAKDGQ